jgi:hypothetical protein
MKVFCNTTYSCSFHISKPNDLKVIHDLCFQYLTHILSETTSFTKPEGARVGVIVQNVKNNKRKAATSHVGER